MIRAMIGTVAVLAGFAVVERSVDASTGQAGSCSPTDVYALPSGASAVVRAGPALDAAVVGALQGDGRASVRMSGSQSGWARISIADDGSRGYGWVLADQLRVDAKASSALYSRPGPMGQKLATLERVGSFRVLGCRGSWLQVINARNGAGWIDKTQS